MPSSPPDGRTAKWILLLTILLLLLARIAGGQEPDAPLAGIPVPDLYKQARRASVEVLVDDHLAGTGFVIDKQGLLFSAAHMLDRPEARVEVISPALGRIEAKLLAVDLGHDLALFRLPPRDEEYPAFELAEKVPPVGERVFLLGTPVYRHTVLLPGMVAREDNVFVYYPGRYVEAVHVAAMVQGGTSGGPWMDAGGRVTGLQSGTMRDQNSPAGIAKMIPVEALRTLLKTRRNAATPTFGAAVEELWQHNRDVLKRFPPRTEALVLRQIQKDGPAARAGLNEWDAVTAADGRQVRVSAELLRIVRAKKPGDVLKLDILGPDGTGTRQVEVRLGCLEAGWPEATEPGSPEAPDAPGD